MKRLLFNAVLLLAVFFVNPTVHADALRTVALSGDPVGSSVAGGLDLQGEFSGFQNPILNEAGQVVFLGTYRDNNNSLKTGVWSEGSGDDLTVVAVEGSVAAGTEREFLKFNFLSLNDHGQTAFIGTLAGAGATESDSHGIWSGGNGPLRLVAREGDPTPIPGDIFTRMASPIVLSNEGTIAFQAGSSNGGLLWTEKSGTLAMVAEYGQNAPGIDAIFRNVGLPVLNNSGQIAIWTQYENSEHHFDGAGIWADNDELLKLVSLAQIGARSTGFGVSPSINDAGQIAFSAAVSDSIESRDFVSGVWVADSNSFRTVAGFREEAPGTEGIFGQFSQPLLNGEGATAFYARFGGPGTDPFNATGIWSDSSGALELIARSGDGAPGTDETFDLFRVELQSPVYNLAINSAGQVAFRSKISGRGVNSLRNEGIWAQDASGVLQLVVRKGDQLDVDDGPGVDLRTIRHLGFGLLPGSGNEDGRPSFFNDRGQLVFAAQFTDGTSGIFVSNLVAIPEPSSVFLTLLACSVFVVPRTR